MSAQWHALPGFENRYEVSSAGDVRRIATGHVLAQGTDRKGYRWVSLSLRGRTKRVRLHRLVALAFRGEPAPRQEVRHLDGNPGNNRATNLKWGSKSENRLDSVRHGTHYSHSAHKTACDHGHDFTPENTAHLAGKRVCKRCRLDRQTKYRANKRQKAAEARA